MEKEMRNSEENVAATTALEGSNVSRRISAHEPVTAIVLAGGQSKRMGADKRFLPFGGMPLIKHIYDQLVPCFDEIIISTDDASLFGFLNARVVADEAPGEGPLRAVASCLAASRHDLNFVIACDIPWLDITLVANLIAKAQESDCVVPVTEKGYYEPLFALYRKAVLPGMMKVLAAGQRRIVDVFPYCRVTTLPIQSANKIVNMNTIEEYQRQASLANHGFTFR